MASTIDSLVENVRELAINQILDRKFENGEFQEHVEAEVRQTLKQRMSGFSFLQPLLDDESIEEIWINRPGEIWFARNGAHGRITQPFSGQELVTLVERLIRSSGRRLDRSTPFIDAQLANGYRFHAVIPDITKNHLSLNIRKFTAEPLTLNDLVGFEVISEAQAKYLIRELKMGANLLISGATQAGKTTLLSALLSALPETERVISVEDTFELRCTLPDWVAMQTRPASLEGRFEIDLRRLVRETLRMRPTRLVVGEVRGAESLDMLIAMNSGVPGLCTIHANSSAEALQKIRTLPLLAGSNISSEFLEAAIRSSLNLFVHCVRDAQGFRKVQSIMRISDSQPLTLEQVNL